jgi:hypothetical protein
MFLAALSSLLFPLSVSAAEVLPETDPREVAGYHVIFDLDASGKSEVVDGYGAYFQWFDQNPSKPFFRYCDNFEGRGLDGRPNKSRVRRKHVAIGTASETSYICHDYTPAQVAAGHKLISVGDKYLFAVRTAGWSGSKGGDILFQIAKKIPTVGSPTYRTIRVRVVRDGDSWKTDTVVPRLGEYPTNWMRFAVSSSALGFPNGIRSLLLNPGQSNEHEVAIDDLEPAAKL